MKEVTIYSASFCPFCTRAKELFAAKKVEFEEIDVGEDPEKRAKIEEESGWMTVPMIFIGEEFVGGYEETLKLEQSGELDRLLEGK